jgi:glycerol-3-phosphate acyltransferase PlsX
VTQRVRVALDAAGGDNAPADSVKGAIKAARKSDVEILLVGPLDALEPEIHACGGLPHNITLVPSGPALVEGEPATHALRRKSSCSVATAARLLRDGEADAFVSAGSTGAASVSAIYYLGMLPGIGRPAVCVPLVGLAPETVLIDGGANVDCKPSHMLSFGAIGTVYARRILGVENPTVALLSTGIEQGKGTRLLQESYPLLQQSGLNFVGNIEGYDVLSGKANVIVCDGIIGNVLLKFYESLGPSFTRWMRTRLQGRPLVGAGRRVLCQIAAFTRLTRDESTGGGLLWGVNGVVQIMHGSSRAPHFERAIFRARDAVAANVVEELRAEFSGVQERCQAYVESHEPAPERPPALMPSV